MLKKMLIITLGCSIMTPIAYPAVRYGDSGLRKPLGRIFLIVAGYATGRIIRNVYKNFGKLFKYEKKSTFIDKILKRTSKKVLNFKVLKKISIGLASIVAFGYYAYRFFIANFSHRPRRPGGPNPGDPFHSLPPGAKKTRKVQSPQSHRRSVLKLGVREETKNNKKRKELMFSSKEEKNGKKSLVKEV